MSDWRDEANCRTIDPDAMQPEAATADQVADALEVCTGCPVMAQCRELAESQATTDGHGAYGVWSGEWWGDPPRVPMVACEWCGAEVENAVGGRVRRYCSPAHQKAARRAQLARTA